MTNLSHTDLLKEKIAELEAKQEEAAFLIRMLSQLAKLEFTCPHPNKGCDCFNHYVYQKVIDHTMNARTNALFEQLRAQEETK